MPDKDEFERLLGDVKKLRSQNRADIQKVAEKTPSQAQRRHRAQTESKLSLDPLSGGDGVPLIDPHALLEFKRGGIQGGLFRQLRTGKMPIETSLDLHGLKVEQARQAVYQFIQDCTEHDIRCVLITHGKGIGREKPALLKSCVAHWLPQIETVLAFNSSQAHHGGSGAVYVLLKKVSHD